MEATDTPKKVADLKFRMLFQGKGEGQFQYRVTAIETGYGEERVGFTREHDGAKIIVKGSRFEEFIKNGSMTFIGY